MPTTKTWLPRSLCVAGALTFAFAAAPENGQAQQSNSQQQENQQQRNVQQPLVQELNSLPTAEDKEFYRQALKERNYQITRTTLDTKEVLQLEAEKEGKTITLSIGFDPQTGKSKEVQATLLSPSSTVAALGQSQQMEKIESEQTPTRTDASPSQQGQQSQDKVVAKVPIIKEEVQVGTREVQQGGVRIETEVTKKPVEKDVQLREEKVTMERRKVDRPVTEADRQALKEVGDTIVVAETVEKPVVSKEARVVGEVIVRKEVEQNTEKVAETVRSTDVEVEQLKSQQQARATQQGQSKDAQQQGGSSQQLVQELETLPLEQNEQFYRETLKERGYQITDTKGDQKQKEFQVEKEGQALVVVIMFDENTGKSTDVSASQQAQPQQQRSQAISKQGAS